LWLHKALYNTYQASSTKPLMAALNDDAPTALTCLGAGYMRHDESASARRAPKNQHLNKVSDVLTLFFFLIEHTV
jgi:hypothetical protein